jgi:8-amino-7-oxononanoate synthase
LPSKTNLKPKKTYFFSTRKQHPKIKQAFKQGVDKFGVGAGASHLISGHTPAHQALEEALAD